MSVIQLFLHVEEPAVISTLYNTIQVWRAPTQEGSPDPFVEITAPYATPAFLDNTTLGPWDLDGLTLGIALDGGASRNITFSSASPMALAEVITSINNIIPGLCTEAGVNTGLIRLTSAVSGTNSSIQVQPSIATTRLGFSTIKTNGKNARILISSTAEEYEFVDYDGLDSFWYRTRFYHNITGALSDFSDAQRGTAPAVIPSSSLLHCFVYLADGAGNPIVNRRIMLVPMGQVQITNDDNQTYSILSSVDRITMITNEVGYAEESLVRGQRFKIFIEGTPFEKEVIIPNTGTELNLLTAPAVVNDPFSIVTTPPLIIRAS